MDLITLMFMAAAANAMQTQQQRPLQQAPPPPPPTESVLPPTRRQTTPPRPLRLRTFLAHQFEEGFREDYSFANGITSQPQPAHTSANSPFASPQSPTSTHNYLYAEQLRQQQAAREANRREQEARAQAELLAQVQELQRQAEEIIVRMEQIRAQQAAATAAEARAEHAGRQAAEECEDREAEQARTRAEEARREREMQEEAMRRQRASAAFAAAEAARKKRQWNTYQVAWLAFEKALNSGSRLKGAKENIPWPVAGGKCLAVLDEELVKTFFMECACCWDSEKLSQMYRAEQVRWHPDKMRQKLTRSGWEWEVVAKEVTVVSQVINGLVAV